MVGDEVLQALNRCFAALDAAVAFDGFIDEAVVRPFFAEAAVQEEKEVQDLGRRADEMLFIFPVEKGDLVGVFVVGDIAQGRPWCRPAAWSLARPLPARQKALRRTSA